MYRVVKLLGLVFRFFFFFFAYFIQKRVRFTFVYSCKWVSIYFCLYTRIFWKEWQSWKAFQVSDLSLYHAGGASVGGWGGGVVKKLKTINFYTRVASRKHVVISCIHCGTASRGQKITWLVTKWRPKHVYWWQFSDRLALYYLTLLTKGLKAYVDLPFSNEFVKFIFCCLKLFIVTRNSRCHTIYYQRRIYKYYYEREMPYQITLFHYFI
jgi:hypothetical protein